jgi:hypothetical protein
MELFLKARLMDEHWTLLVNGKEPITLAKFASGDFVSVGLDDAIIRLERVVGSKLRDNFIRSLNNLKQHRNKSMHFFHETFASKSAGNARNELAMEELTVWYFMHQQLTSPWQAVFKDWLPEITKIDQKVRTGLSQYLDVIYQNIRDDIRSFKTSGFEFCECPSCGHEAEKYRTVENGFYNSECLVCRIQSTHLSIQCPKCQTEVHFRDEGYGMCLTCQTKFEPNNLADLLVDDAAELAAIKDGDETPVRGNCTSCDGYQTIVLTKGDGYRCCQCFTEFDTLERCGWCGEANSYISEDSFLTGCSVCSGRMGHNPED